MVVELIYTYKNSNNIMIQRCSFFQAREFSSKNKTKIYTKSGVTKLYKLGNILIGIFTKSIIMCSETRVTIVFQITSI